MIEKRRQLACWEQATIDREPGDDETKNIYLPQTPEGIGYDADGNLTSDGRWTYTWDGENRLIRMEAISAAPAGAKLKLTFDYDHQGRRVRKQGMIGPQRHVRAREKR